MVIIFRDQDLVNYLTGAVLLWLYRDQEGHTVVDNVLYNGMFHLLPAYYEHLINLMKTNGVTNMEKLVLNGYDYIANTVDGFDALKIAKENGLSEVVAFLQEAPKMFVSKPNTWK